MKQLIKVKEIIKNQRQFLLYGVFGGISAGLDFCVFSFLLSIGLNYLIANIIGVHFGIFNSFMLNRQFNFKVKDKTARRMFTFYLVGLIGLGLSSILLYLLVETAGWQELYSKLLTIFFVAVTQFYLNKLITFKVAITK
jgi:putative flippase GtrA